MRSWRTWLGILISGVFLYLAFRQQDLGEIRDALGEANFWWIPLALLFYFIGVWIRAIRWRFLLRPLVETSARSLFPIVVVGYMANNVLPLRAGELVRSYLLSRNMGIRKTSGLATIAVERLFDGLTMLGFIFIAMSFVSLTNQLENLAVIAATLFGCLLVGLFLLTLGGGVVERLLQVVLGPLPNVLSERVERLAQAFLSGLGVLKRRRDLAAVAGTSILAWSFEAAMYFTIARGFGPAIRETIGVFETLLTTGAANMATLIPSSPGYIGVFESAILLVLNGALGVPQAQVLAYAIVVHATLLVPITLLGIIEWIRQQVSLKHVHEQRSDPTMPVDPSSTPVAGAGSPPKS